MQSEALAKKTRLVYNPFMNKAAGEAVIAEVVITLDDTKTRIILAAIKAVRQYGLGGCASRMSVNWRGFHQGQFTVTLMARINCWRNALLMWTNRRQRFLNI